MELIDLNASSSDKSKLISPSQSEIEVNIGEKTQQQKVEKIIKEKCAKNREDSENIERDIEIKNINKEDQLWELSHNEDNKNNSNNLNNNNVCINDVNQRKNSQAEISMSRHNKNTGKKDKPGREKNLKSSNTKTVHNSVNNSKNSSKPRKTQRSSNNRNNSRSSNQQNQENYLTSIQAKLIIFYNLYLIPFHNNLQEKYNNFDYNNDVKPKLDQFKNDFNEKSTNLVNISKFYLESTHIKLKNQSDFYNKFLIFAEKMAKKNWSEV